LERYCEGQRRARPCRRRRWKKPGGTCTSTSPGLSQRRSPALGEEPGSLFQPWTRPIRPREARLLAVIPIAAIPRRARRGRTPML